MTVRSWVIAVAMLAFALASGCKPSGVHFQSVNPAQGRHGGGEEVRIRGSGFEALGGLEVRIGGRPAANVGILGDETIVLTTPEGQETATNRAQDITILTNTGRSYVLRGAFTYRPGAGGGGGPAGGPNEDLRRRL